MAEPVSEAAVPLLRSVGRADAQLEKLLPERDSLQRVLGHLESVTTEPLLVEEAFERRRLWQDAGLFYSNSGRLLEAIELF